MTSGGSGKTPPLSAAARVALAERLRARKPKAAEAEKIPRLARDGRPLPTSFGQARLWFLEQLQPGTATYNVPLLLRLEGTLDTISLERALAELVTRHETLRTTFVEIDGEPHQIVRPSLAFELRHLEAASDDEARAVVSREMHAPFDLTEGPLFRAALVRRTATNHELLLCAHHIATDGWSMDLLVTELSALYRAFAEGKPSPLAPTTIDYADFAVWQRSQLTDDRFAKQLAFWKEHLAGAPAGLEVPTDHPRPATKQNRGAGIHLLVGRALSDRVRALCQAEGTTPFMVLLATFQTLLARWSGQSDVVVGTPIANRTRKEVEGIVGFFVNTLALRASFAGNPSFVDLLRQVRGSALAAYGHQDLPFERLVDELRPPRETGRTPVFQTMFVLQHDTGEARSLGEVTIAFEVPQFDVTKFDLTLGFTDQNGVFRGELRYDVALFDRSTIERMAEHFTSLLESAVETPSLPVALLPMLGDAERHRLLDEWNATATALPDTRPMHEIFEARAAATPERIALVMGDEQLTYQELDARANDLAHALQAGGVRRESIVAVSMDRSFEMVIALYAVLKAGGAYAPLDPQLPRDRLAFMARDLGVPVVLVRRGTAPTFDTGDSAVIEVDAHAPITKPSKPSAPIDDRQLAYVIFTSGSTGLPKAAANTHAGLRNRMLWMQSAYPLDEHDRVLQKTPFSFDVSVWEFFWPLAFGARLVIARPEGHKDPTYLAQLIRSAGITTLHFVPSMLQVFLEEPTVPTCTSLRRVVCSGEALPRALAQRFFARLGCELHNLYGPTEASVDVTYFQCRPDDPREVPIGKPIWNTGLYVVDEHMEPVPIGVAGELCLAGIGLARGYYGRPELTAARFVACPFGDSPGARMYRTGDLARWLPTGEVEYLGRLDHQVKLRGYRIELGEIESLLAGSEGVGAAVVLAREDVPGDKRLVAYVLAAAGASVDVATLKAGLARALPDYMVPSAFVVLDALPLTPSGKVDRKALPKPDFTIAAAEYAPPRGGTEEAIAQIFQELLRVERVGRDDDFFALGGHSLLVTRVMLRIRERLDVSLPVATLFEAPTVARLAERVDSARTQGSRPGLERVASRQGPLSYNQTFWWRRQQSRPDSPGYKYTQAYRLRGALDEATFARSVDEETRRHHALRTTFEVIGGDAVQVVLEPRAGCLALVDMTGATLADVDAWMNVESDRRPDLLGGQPFPRLALLRVATDDHVLVITGHRATLDPALCDDVVTEIMAIYGAFVANAPSPLPEPAFQYGDFVAWQRKLTDMPEVTARLAEARTRLAGASPLALPVDREQSEEHTTRTHRAAVSMDDAVWSAISGLSRAHSTTQFVILSAILKGFLFTLTQQTDITVVAPNELTRGLHESLGAVLGCFHDYFILRSDLSESPSVREVVRREHAVVLAAQRDVDIPCALVTQDYVDNPLWRIALNFVPATGERTRRTSRPPPASMMVVEAMSVPRHRMVDLAWAIFGTTGALFTAADLFDASTTTRLAGELRTFMEKALAAPDTPIDRL